MPFPVDGKLMAALYIIILFFPFFAVKPLLSAIMVSMWPTFFSAEVSPAALYVQRRIVK